MVVSDHFTPVAKRTHTSEPAPFAFASKAELASLPGGYGFTEKNAQKSGDIFWNGHDLMPTFLGQFS